MMWGREMALSGLKNTFASWASAVALAATMALTPAAAEGNAPAQGTADLSTTHAAAAKVVKPGRVKALDARSKSAKLREALPVRISNGRVAAIIHVPNGELTHYDQGFFAALRDGAEDYAKETGLNMAILILPDNDDDNQTLRVEFWANNFKRYTLDTSKLPSDTLMSPDERRIRAEKFKNIALKTLQAAEDNKEAHASLVATLQANAMNKAASTATPTVNSPDPE